MHSAAVNYKKEGKYFLSCNIEHLNQNKVIAEVVREILYRRPCQ